MKIYISLLAAFIALSSTSAFAARCADYATCREAVVAWCEGRHPRADGDKDGIPCENVCKSRAQVERIKSEIGCTR